MKRILVLGAGLVSRPLVDYFLQTWPTRVVVASLALDEARAVARDHPNSRAVALDLADAGAIDPLLEESDLVFSLLPATLHASVARAAIRHRVPLVTTSYVSDEMRQLDRAARAAGVTLLNEIGLDPGLDHMSALRMIRRVQAAGARVVEFRSACGSLPTLEAADNPWRHRFAWSPRGALVAAGQPARYREAGRVIELPAIRLFQDPWSCDVDGVGTLQMIPNRDSLPYAEAYGIEDAQTMIRATLRWPGWCETLDAVARLDWLDTVRRDRPAGTTVAEVMTEVLAATAAPPVERVARQLGLTVDHRIVDRFVWAGLLDPTPIEAGPTSRLDLLAKILSRKLAFREGQADLVVLRHELLVEDRSGRRWRDCSWLVQRGVPGQATATARTVSLPAAVAGRLLLEGQIRCPGVLCPTDPKIYEPVLDELERLGITLIERREPADPDRS